MRIQTNISDYSGRFSDAGIKLIHNDRPCDYPKCALRPHMKSDHNPDGMIAHTLDLEVSDQIILEEE